MAEKRDGVEMRSRSDLAKFMKRLIATIILFFLAFPSFVQAIDVKSLFQKSLPSVVLVMSFDSNGQPLAIGSGFFVDNGEKIATNLHVIEGASAIRIKQNSGSVLEIRNVIGIDREHDLVLLKSPVAIQPLALSSREPEIGEDVISIGNPKGLEGTLSSGIVSGVRREGGSVYYQITAPISPGNSGGPIITEEGKVIGVSTFYVSGGQNLNFAMPSAYIYKMIRNPINVELAKIPPRTQPQFKSVNENVMVIEPYIDGISSNLQASVLNKSSQTISNIRLVATFYNQNSGNPVHFLFIEVKDAIPPSLAKRFERGDSNLMGHGGKIFDSPKGKWRVDFRVLDYEISSKGVGGDGIPVFQ